MCVCAVERGREGEKMRERLMTSGSVHCVCMCVSNLHLPLLLLSFSSPPLHAVVPMCFITTLECGIWNRWNHCCCPAIRGRSQTPFPPILISIDSQGEALGPGTRSCSLSMVSASLHPTVSWDVGALGAVSVAANGKRH